MASTTAAASQNGASILGSSSAAAPSSSTPTSRSSASKQPASAKVADATRKQSSSPMDNAQRPPPTQKAWTTGTNPLTQKPVAATRQNGTIVQSRLPADSRLGQSSATKSAHDKMMFLLANCIGTQAKVTLQGGDIISGIFSSASLDNAEPKYVLKMASKLAQVNHEVVNGSTEVSPDYIGEGEDHTLILDPKEVVDFAISGVSTTRLQPRSNGAPEGFKTDTDISGNLSFRERKLKMWEPSDGSSSNLSLSSGGKAWDQFETNERLYGVKTDFDENIYTTTLDRSRPDYQKRVAAADKLAREIMESAPANAHVAEERGHITQDDTGDMDEESRYSGVRREPLSTAVSQINKYTPPARRAPTGQATVSGAPVDPAIISAQLVRPDTSKQPQINPGTVQSTTSTGAVSEEPPAIAALPQDVNNGKTAVDGAESKQAAPETSAPLASAGNNTVNATANVEAEVLESYKTWAAQEKMKLQFQRQQAIRREREVKLNDLKKFSVNFKLHTKVPKDLVPLLTNDKIKQDEIVAKNTQRQLEAQTAAMSKSAVGSSSAALPRVGEKAQPSAISSADRNNSQTGRQTGVVPADRGASFQTIPSGPASKGNLSTRLTQSTQQFMERNPNFQHSNQALPTRDSKTGNGQVLINTDVERQRRPSVQSPTSAQALKFNAKAVEFRPTAPSFTPTSGQSVVGSSRPDSDTKGEKVSATRPSFLESKKPRTASERPSIADAFNPIVRMKKEVEVDRKADYSSNGGIPQAYKTPPTWEAAKDNEEKSYIDMFQKYLAPPLSRSSSHASPASGAFAHQHQLPPHMQSGTPSLPQMQMPQGTPRHPHSQPHHAAGGSQYFDDNRMHLSASQSSVYPSPRMQQPMIYNPMMPQMHGVYGQPMAQYNISPGSQNMQHMRAMPPGAHFMHPSGSQMGTPMMMQASNGGSTMGYPMQLAQMPMYAAGQPPTYPAHGGQMHVSPMYGSPRQTAPMMVQQGSQQGQMMQPFGYPSPNQPNGFMYPPYAQQGPMTPMRGMAIGLPQQHSGYSTSPHMQHHYPAQQQQQQHGRGSFSGYTTHMSPNPSSNHQSNNSGDETQRNGA